jgi:uncharacterized protein (DUF302 family)
MDYYLAKPVDLTFDGAIDKVTALLKDEGFGILTVIDIKETLKKKINVDFRKYTILGACNPKLAHQALTHEDKVGVLLPCNVVVQEHEDGRVEVVAMDPLGSMEAIGNPALSEMATEVRTRLERVLAGL